MSTENETVTIRRDDLDTLVLACLKYLPDDAADVDPDVRAAFARLDDARHGTGEPEPASAVPGDGQWLRIAFMGHNEYTGYVTETVKNGQPAYHVDLPGKLWGGNPLDYVEYAASAWFSDQPVTEEFVRKAWERHLREVAERKRREAEWQRMQEQRAITDGRDEDSDSGEDLDDEDVYEAAPGWPN